MTLLCKVGNDAFGKLVQSIVAEYGASGVLVDDNSDTSYSVVLALPGLDRIFIHCPGANDMFESVDISDEMLDGAAIFHLGYPTLMKKLYENDVRTQGDGSLVLTKRLHLSLSLCRGKFPYARGICVVCFG